MAASLVRRRVGDPTYLAKELRGVYRGRLIACWFRERAFVVGSETRPTA
jgi:hypothetical protein